MVILNGKNLLNNQHVKCGALCEELVNHSRNHNFLSSGLNPAFHRLENVLSVSNIEVGKNHPNVSLCTRDLIENNNDGEFKAYVKENDCLVHMNQHGDLTNEGCTYYLPNVTLRGEDYSETEVDVKKIHNLYSIPEGWNFDKKNAMIVNYTITKNGETDEASTSSQRERQLSPNIYVYKQSPKDRLKTSTGIHEVDSKIPQSRTRDKRKKNVESSKKDTFNMMSKDQKIDNDASPRHLHSSFITEEYKKTSFFDDFLESRPSYSSYADTPSELRRFECSEECMGTKIADILTLPIENEFNSRIPTKNTEFDPQVCYMEPKGCSMSCQGIPHRTQRYGVFRPELQRFTAYPESNVANYCCSSDWNFYGDSGLIDLDERYYCRRKPVQNNLFQDDTYSSQRQPGCYCLRKPSATENARKNPFQTDLQDFTQYQRQPECCDCKKTNVEKTKITKINDDTLHHGQPQIKKKKHFTCCKSKKVDKGVLSAPPESTPEETQQNSQQSKSQNSPTNKTFMRNPCQGQLPPNAIPIQNIYTDNHIDRRKDCPMVMQPEKEHHLIYMPPPHITKSVGCECDHKHTLSKCPDNTMDIGRNITIQIIPNYCQKSCSEHQNTTAVSYPHVEQKVTYPQSTDCQEIPRERKQSKFPTKVGYQQVTYQPYAPNESKAISYKSQGECQKYDSISNSSKWWGCNWRRKKPQTPYHRNPNIAETNDCCTTTCQGSNDVVATDCRTVEISNCQRVLPIRNNYINKDGNLLKSLHRLNRGLLKDLFATPCASSASACPNSCLEKMRGAPFPMCSGTNPSCHAAKPLTTNQSCQYEPNCCYYSEREKICNSSQDMLFECLKYLKKGIMNEHDSEYIDEDCCCCCCRSFNNCSCCHKIPRCGGIEEVIQPKIEEKKSKSCCTRCRSVEAKQSLRHCGTVVSNHCFTRVETVCTNTEIRPKTPEVKKRRMRCQRRCCCCCNNARNCCCCCERFSCSEPAHSCCRNIHSSSCKGEHLIYCCQCEPKPIFECKNLVPKQTKKDKCIEVLKTELEESVSKETENTGIKDITSDISPNYLNTPQETSINNNSLVKYRPQRKDVLIKSITLDLCELGEKKFSKFGVPSQHYHWMNDSFFVDMPNEMNRYAGIGKYEHPLFEKVYDPTPCLTPEVIHFSYSQSHEVKQADNEINELNAGGDKEKLSEVQKRYLSTVCEEFFNNKQTNNQNFFHIKNDNTNPDSFNYVHLDNKMKEDILKNEISDKEGIKFKDDDIEKRNMVEDKLKLTNDDAVHKQQHKQAEPATKSKNLLKNSKIICKSTEKITSKTSSNIYKKSNISKTSSNLINYSPKPFTTKTGLMSFVPPFRDNYRSLTQVKKNKSAIPVHKNTTLLKKPNKNKVENIKENSANKIEIPCSDGKDIFSMNTTEYPTKNELIEGESTVESKSKISKPKSKYMNRDESEKKEINEKEMKADEQNDEKNKAQKAPTAKSSIPFTKKKFQI